MVEGLTYIEDLSSIEPSAQYLHSSVIQGARFPRFASSRRGVEQW